MLGAVATAAFVGSIVLVDVAYAITRNRYVGTRGSGLRAVPFLKLSERDMANVFLQLMLPIVFAANLVLQLTTRHHYADLEPIRNAEIAPRFVFIPLNPVSAYFLWKRYREALRRGLDPYLAVGR